MSIAPSTSQAVEQRVSSLVLLVGSLVSATGAGLGILAASWSPEQAMPFDMVTMPTATVLFSSIFLAILVTGNRYNRQIAYVWVAFSGLFNLIAVADALFVSPSPNLVFYLLWIPLYYIFLSFVLNGRQAFFVGWGCFLAVVLMFLVYGLTGPGADLDGREFNLLVQSAATQGGTLGLMYFFRVYRERFHHESERSSEYRKIAAELEAAVQREQATHQQVEIANQAKIQFLAGMSHELRMPLNAINGFSEMISKEIFGPLENEKYREYIEDIHRAGVHLLAMVEDTFDLAKIEAGRMELELEPVRLGRVAQDAINMTSGGKHGKNLDMRAEISPDLPRLTGDSRALRQIAINLVSNARKFTASGGRVTLRAKLAPDGGIVFEVSDTGIGIPKEEIAKVVEPFYHLNNTLDPDQDSSGLGLSLVKRLVELHGGDLNIVSAVGKGTVVSCKFPRWRTVTERA
ncbi:MAG: HAMP domain-containing sensor histidine kinase [Proteobacteria bacterium]|nr:HAMP domain-containing sensor histidine kinase [Pseudomonadota bacterium]MDA1354877.1 HAMP domain-containing sensor histidine kinase [Pseudomonadota bacterium]